MPVLDPEAAPEPEPEPEPVPVPVPVPEPELELDPVKDVDAVDAAGSEVDVQCDDSVLAAAALEIDRPSPFDVAPEPMPNEAAPVAPTPLVVTCADNPLPTPPCVTPAVSPEPDPATTAPLRPVPNPDDVFAPVPTPATAALARAAAFPFDVPTMPVVAPFTALAEPAELPVVKPFVTRPPVCALYSVPLPPALASATEALLGAIEDMPPPLPAPVEPFDDEATLEPPPAPI
jgi:nicotinate-nucleotide--dimethylbenzimidazole phosphoribosyltransferase